MAMEVRRGSSVPVAEPRSLASVPEPSPRMVVVDGRHRLAPRPRSRWAEVPVRVLLSMDEDAPPRIRLEFFDGERKVWRLDDDAHDLGDRLAGLLRRKVDETGAILRW